MTTVLLVGSGAREHALARSLVNGTPGLQLHVTPGNPGISEFAVQAHAVAATDTAGVVDLARRIGADLVVVGPEEPLTRGVADAVRACGIACFGPDAAAARIEGSKAFAKAVMLAAGVPTAAASVCSTLAEVDAALSAVGRPGIPFVVKEDGLAAGKGVVVTVDREAARAHAAAVLAAGSQALVEEYLDGPEVSLFFLSDGTAVRALLPAADFKRAYDNDEGPNTGGMGAYSPLRWAPDDLVDVVTDTIALPTIAELRRRGTPFVGLLYVGLALTSNGIRVVEFNARFGDPETQAVLALLTTPLYDALHAAATGALADLPELAWRDGSAVVVVMAAAGYPQAPVTGAVISGDLGEHVGTGAGTGAGADGDGDAGADGVGGERTWVLQAGTSRDSDGRLVTSGGRVLSVVGCSRTLGQARELAYARVAGINFEGSHYRSDIALGASTAVGR